MAATIHFLHLDKDQLQKEERFSRNAQELQHSQVQFIPQRERPDLSIPASSTRHPGLRDPRFVADRGPDSSFLHRPDSLAYGAYEQLEKRRKTEDLQNMYNSLTPAGGGNGKNWLSNFNNRQMEHAKQRLGCQEDPDVNVVKFLSGLEQIPGVLDLEKDVAQALYQRDMVRTDGAGTRGGARSMWTPGPTRDARSAEDTRLNKRMKALARLRSMTDQHRHQQYKK